MESMSHEANIISACLQINEDVNTYLNANELIV